MTGDRPPSGCRWCGRGRHDHYQRWYGAAGWHEYEHPTTEQIKTRMLARRAATTTPGGTT